MALRLCTLSEIHADERGSISLATVFALLLLTILLGMVLNIGRQVDNKIKLQNAADAATYSGGVVLSRGMNSLAFSNHMLCEVFALTAVMREARDRHAEPLVPAILAEWNRIAPTLSGSAFPKFSRLGNAIPQKTPLEQEMVRSYSAWMAASSELVLPVLEQILQQQLIPQFQRDVVQATPPMAQIAAARIAQQHTGANGPHDATRGLIDAVLWRTVVDPVGGSGEQTRTTLPAVDPQVDPSYQLAALSARNRYAQQYLRLWNNALLQPFDTDGKMSQFGSLWRGFTCGQLTQLLSEYQNRNLPHMIREQPPQDSATLNTWLTQDYEFVGVAYRRKLTAAIPRLFPDSLLADNQTFAQGALFVPRRRPVDVGWWQNQGVWYWGFITDGVPERWDLWNQHWSFQLVPATTTSISAILSQQPLSPYVASGGQTVVNLGNASPADLRQVTTH